MVACPQVVACPQAMACPQVVACEACLKGLEMSRERCLVKGYHVGKG